MEIIIFAIVALILIGLAVLGIAWAGMSSRMRQQGGDRQEYRRPPHGSTSR